MTSGRAFVSTAAAALTHLASTGDAKARGPNIVYIMSDDHAAQAIGCYGSNRNETPNIDRIAGEGMRFDNCLCVNSICTPSRAAILTGKYGHVTGVKILGQVLSDSEQTFPKLMQQAGYQTAIIGKWHLAGNDPAKHPPGGFDHWCVLPGQGKYFNPVMFENGARRVLEGYVTDIITDLSIEFLKNREKSKPFLLLCHHKAPHGPWEYDRKHAHLYEGRDLPEPQTLWDDYRNRSNATKNSRRTISILAERMQDPEWPTGQLNTEGLAPKERKRLGYQKYIKDYLRCVASIDDNVGRLLDWLDEEGIADDTIVIYTSDQGKFLGEHGWYDKRFFYEESLRMPLLIRYPKEIKAGSVNSDMVLNVDFAETFLEYAGVPAPKDMQGRSFRSLLRGLTPQDWRASMLYSYHMHGDTPPHYGVRTARYKLIHFVETKEWELFDLEKDPMELNSLYDNPEHAGIVEEMKAEFERLRQELDVSDEDLLPVGPREGWKRRTKAKRGAR